jgi:predicted Zn-dependent protease
LHNDVNNNAYSLELQSDLNYQCIKINDKFDEIFYTFYVYKRDDKNYQFATPLFPGLYDYYSSIYMIYIPIIAEDFNYLTYKINNYQKEIKVYLTSYNNYPLCILNIDPSLKTKEFERFYDFHFITFMKNELKSNWSPINKKQHIIYLNYESSEIYENNIKFEIYTDRTILDIKTGFVNYYYLEKGNTNNFLFSQSSFSIKKGIISIQRITGDISIDKIELNNEIIKNNNIFSYKFDENQKYIKIKAEKNSIYNIKIQAEKKDEDENSFRIKLGGKYIFELNDDLNISLSQFFSFHEKYITNYFSIYPIECNVNATYITKHSNYGKTDETLLPLKINNGFYQYIYQVSEDKLTSLMLWIKKQSNKDSGNILFSYFLLEENTNQYYLDTGIILDENIPHLFLFSKDYNEVYFYYFHTSINSNITLDLHLSKEGNYQINLLINDKEVKEQYHFISSKKFHLDKKIWKNICNANHVCRLSFIITNFNKNDSSLKIIIQVENDKNDNNETNAILIIILVIICLILIVGIIIIILKFRNKGNNLYNNVNDIKEEKETELFDKGKD